MLNKKYLKKTIWINKTLKFEQFTDNQTGRHDLHIHNNTRNTAVIWVWDAGTLTKKN